MDTLERWASDKPFEVEVEKIMPWAKNEDLPGSIKDNLPDAAQTTWRKIANAALDEYKDESKALATAWAWLRTAGWDKDKDGKWIKKVHEFKIEKSNNEKQLAFGWVIVSTDRDGKEVFDLQNDGIDSDELEDLAYKYVRFYRDSGELHLTAGKAVVIESVVTTLEKQLIWGVPKGVMPVGWWCGFYVSDKSVWEKVKDGTYKAFSIEGSALRKGVI